MEAACFLATFGALMVNACLIIVFNHRYDKNIPVLEQIYGPRFRNIFFLVPFYDGDHPRVIPVYESSNYFQSFFAQGFRQFYQESFTHYIFLGDDCILNPSIDEHNVIAQAGIPAGADYLPGIIEFHKISGDGWWHSFKGIDFFKNRKGAEIGPELPSREEAVRRFNNHGLAVKPLKMRNIFGSKRPAGRSAIGWWLFKQYHWRIKWKAFVRGGRLQPAYPIAGSYADIVVVTAGSIREFCRYCGIMAAAGVFVEIAIPTALILASRSIVQETQLSLQGLAMWMPAEITAVEQRFGTSLSKLLQGFPKGQLYYHPIKISRWKNDL